MKQTILRGLIVGALVTVSAVAINQGALAAQYRVTVTNATHGQPLAPGLIITHDGTFSLFEIGDAPSADLATMAETGNPSDLAGSVAATTADVLFGDHGGIALPSESNDIVITTGAEFLTAVGMLAATNDGFYAVRGVKLPASGEITVFASAYDAGSEENNEKSGDVPASKLGNSKDAGTDAGDGEGFIHVHNGIYGGGQLKPSVHGWRNPVVEITIEFLP